MELRCIECDKLMSEIDDKDFEKFLGKHGKKDKKVYYSICDECASSKSTPSIDGDTEEYVSDLVSRFL